MREDLLSAETDALLNPLFYHLLPHIASSFLSLLDLGDGATILGTKREMDSTMNGRPIMVGSTQNVSGGSWFKSGIRWALST